MKSVTNGQTAPSHAAAAGEEHTTEFESAVDSYRRLADVFHDVLSEQRLELLLDRIADTLAELVPYDTLSIYQADEAERRLNPVLARDEYIEEILKETDVPFGEGITGWAVEHREPVLANEAATDPRVVTIPGTSDDEDDSVISVPLIANGSVKGALNIYRLGQDTSFSEEDFELAKRFGDAAALALDNAQVRAALEHQAQTDSLTGLYNHRYFQERFRAELMRVNRAHDSLAVLMLDIDDFKKINDVHSHSVGDHILVRLADIVTSEIRGSDVACRIGGEEFAVIMPSCRADEATRLAERLATRLGETSFDPAGHITLSIGIAEGPRHASGPQELVACAETAMMTAKADGKNKSVVFEDEPAHRPQAAGRSDLRNIAHLKMLQSLAGRLSGLSSPEVIGATIVEELRSFIDYDTCCAYKVEGDDIVPLAARSSSGDEDIERLPHKVGVGLTGRTVLSGKPLVVPNLGDYEHDLPGFENQCRPQSAIAVPLHYGERVVGVVVVSKLAAGSLDQDDIRLLEVLAGHAAVALENASLYEAQRREADHAKALVDFADAMFNATSIESISEEAARMGARLLDSDQALLWLRDLETGVFAVAGHFGMADDPRAQPILDYSIGEELAGKLLEEQERPSVVSAAHVAGLFPEPPGVVYRSMAIAPLRAGDELEGWLTVRRPDILGWDFTEDRLRLLAGIAHQVSLAIQKARLYKQQRETAETANSLLELSRVLVTAGSLAEVLDRTVERTAKILNVPRASVWLVEKRTGRLVVKSTWGFEDSHRQWMEGFAMPVQVAQAFLAGADPFVLHTSELEGVEGVPPNQPTELSATASMNLNDDGLGFLVAEADDDGEFVFSERRLRLLTGIADQAKLAILNVGGLESLERTFLSTVEALTNALEAKDEYTSLHARSIKDMALKVGLELGLPNHRLKDLELAALFHDIGKIGMPSEVLTKAGPLTDEERTLIETHPDVGAKILAPIERLMGVMPIVRACHERYDGEGYPDGKMGDDIPLESRIIFVCDAFHAMSSDRPYRRHLADGEARRRLRDAAGTQFDPSVVDAFFRSLETEPAGTPVEQGSAAP